MNVIVAAPVHINGGVSKNVNPNEDYSPSLEKTFYRNEING